MKNSRALTWRTLTFVFSVGRRYPLQFYGMFSAIPFAVLTNSFLPNLLVSQILGKLSAHAYDDAHIWHSFGPLVIGYAVVTLLSSLLAWRIVDLFNWHLEGKVERDIAERVFSQMIDLSADFHANSFGGSLVSQTNKLMGAYIRLTDSATFQLLPLFWSLVFASIILVRRAPLYVAALLIFAAIYICSAFYVTRRVRALSAEHAGHESKQTGYLADMITNVMAVKSFAGGSRERSAFSKITNATRASLMRLAKANQKQQAYFSSITGSISIMAVLLSVLSVSHFHTNIATVFLILSYTANINAQLFQFSTNALRTINRALGDAKDMLENLELVPEVQDPVAPETCRIKRGGITFDKVTFTHKGADDAIFDQLSLQIKPGEKVGLVGHSGSGKTTFTRLLLRFSDIDSGRILIDDQSISAITQDDLRRNIAYVPQEPLLFHRSIADNISYGQPGATIEAVQAAAKLAHAEDFIATLPQGYDTLVGERGVKLSGGQRQRIVIARAILKNAPILVLDEATSALDSESEAAIQDALWKLMEGRTAIVIAHRLSTIQRMDRIIVMDDGQIIEQGSHKELIHSGGVYAKLWSRQSGGFIEE